MKSQVGILWNECPAAPDMCPTTFEIARGGTYPLLSCDVLTASVGDNVRPLTASLNLPWRLSADVILALPVHEKRGACELGFARVVDLPVVCHTASFTPNESVTEYDQFACHMQFCYSGDRRKRHAIAVLRVLGCRPSRGRTGAIRARPFISMVACRAVGHIRVRDYGTQVGRACSSTGCANAAPQLRANGYRHGCRVGNKPYTLV